MVYGVPYVFCQYPPSAPEQRITQREKRSPVFLESEEPQNSSLHKEAAPQKLTKREPSAKPLYQSKSKGESLQLRKEDLKPLHFSLSNKSVSPLRSDTLERLRNGHRAKLSKQEMRELTAKHYQDLPEVKEKRLEAVKSQEKFERLHRAKEYGRTISSRIKKLN